MIKILDKNKLLRILADLKKNKKKISLCHGVFDLVHYGHILHFKSAKKLSDVLIVSVTKDKFIKKRIEGPLFNEIQRLNYLNEISLIDYIYSCETNSAEDSIRTIKPDFYVKGPDYKNNLSDSTKKIYLEKKLVKKYGGKIIYTKDEKFSSSKIINEKNLLLTNSDQEKYIKNIKNKFGYNYIKKKIYDFKKIKPLVVGELIIDHYCFGDIIGKAGKEPHLVLKEVSDEYYVGGSGAITRHLSSFVNSVKIIAPFGGEPFLKNLLKKSFDKNVFTNFIKPEKNYLSIIKKRFIDKISNYKMFGSYILPSKPANNFSKILISNIKKNLASNNVLLVCDYGHNFIDKNVAKFISRIKKFKALNAQLNSASNRYHSLNNYFNIDVLVVNETELRQELREEKLDLNILAKILIKKNKIKNLIVTKGKAGVLLYKKNSKPIFCPAFVSQSVDKVGAGDAMLSISSLAIKQGLDPELVLFLGSIAAAISVNNVGNKICVNVNDLDKIIEYMLK
jgi:rfaE bifunctional protein nucleotidyltransferase chain/domain